MGKYSNMMKCAQVRSLVNEKQFKKALDIIEELNIEKINTITDLNIIAEVFKKFERYEDSREIYLRLYDRIQTRRVIYQLIYLSVKCNNIEDAEEFYKEYMELDDNTCDSIILRYYIDKAKGVDRRKLIACLESLKKEDYIEEWAYELAKLYHKEGMKEECIRECTDIILWFGEGTIVEKATLLKLHYVDGADISSAKAIQETRNIAAELKMAAAIAEQNEKRKEEEEKRRKEIFTEIKSKRSEKEEKKQIVKNTEQEMEMEEEDLGETRKIDNLQDYIKRTRKINTEEQIDEQDEKQHLSEENHKRKMEDTLIDEEKVKEHLLEVHKMLDKIREEQDSEDYDPEDYLEDPPEPDEEDDMEEELSVQEMTTTQIEEKWQEPIIPEQDEIISEVMEQEEHINISEPDKQEELKIEEAVEFAKRAKFKRTVLEKKILLQEEIKQEEPQVTEGKEEVIKEQAQNEAEQEEIKEQEQNESKQEEILESQEVLEPVIENAVSKEEQLLINMIQEAKAQNVTPHFAIIGENKKKIAELSKELAKELCRQQILPTSQIAKITADKLNRIKLQDNQKKLCGGCLLIDDAHSLSIDSLQNIYQFLNRNKDEMTIILTDNEKNMDWLMSRNRKLRQIIKFDLNI